jgi:type VI secretion system protein ImpB
MSESLQHKLDRVRRPRVQITYDVETGGATEQKELPFVVGCLADLSGDPAGPQKPLKDRSFTPVDRDNFNDVLAKAKPRLAFKADNKLTDEDSQLNVELNFNEFDDFEPARVARQVPALKELLEMRDKLNELLGKMEGNDKLEALLKDVLASTETATQLAGDLGIDPQAEPAAKPAKPAK